MQPLLSKVDTDAELSVTGGFAREVTSPVLFATVGRILGGLCIPRYMLVLCSEAVLTWELVAGGRRQVQEPEQRF